MTDNMKALVKKVMESKELHAKFAAVKTLEEAYTLAASLQQGLTHEEFFNAAEQLKNSSAAKAELSSEDMEKVAGGIIIIASQPEDEAYDSAYLFGHFINILKTGKTNNGDTAANSSGSRNIIHRH